MPRARYNGAPTDRSPAPMNAPSPASLLSAVELAPRDPILGVTEAFNADPNPRKVNLGVGVYCDDNGKVPLLECVKRAEREMTDNAAPRSYLPIDGIAAYDQRGAATLLFGADTDVGRRRARRDRAGAGRHRRRSRSAPISCAASPPGAQVWISDPSWENHRALFEGAGFTVNTYPYYDAATHGLDFAGMLAALEQLAAGSIVVLHACCHNPTGVDPTPAQWTRIIEVVRARGLVPFLDLAYQGFGDGIDADGAVVRRFAATPGPLLGRELVLQVVLAVRRARRRAVRRRRRPGRGGARAVAAQARSSAPTIRTRRRTAARSSRPCSARRNCARCGRRELATMRNRIKLMRALLVERLHERAAGRRFPLHARAARHVLVFRTDQGAGASAARASTRSTRSTPAASASRRSIRATSTTSPTRSPSVVALDDRHARPRPF